MIVAAAASLDTGLVRCGHHRDRSRQPVGLIVLLFVLAVTENHTARADESSAGSTRQPDEQQGTFLHEQVVPILRRRCFGCHSHAAREMQSGLALDWRSGWEQGGERGPAIVPGNPDQSLLIKAVRHTDPDLKMPEDRLPDAEIDILTRWVTDGAFDDRTARPAAELWKDATNWWSLRPLVRGPVPGRPGGSSAENQSATNPIDAFVRQRLAAEGITPSPEADRRTLIRRVMFDLIGLPPSPEEVAAFVADPDPEAYEKLVERLLLSPRHGERWARHWMDTIHFADSHGFEHDIPRENAWRYRDYLIESFNRDTPWSRFIREQIAVDAIYPQDSTLTPALGFLSAGPFDLSAYSTAPVTFEYIDRDDLVAQTMAAFTSTTANCARCHDHKFDPITQDDYYSLQAVFAGITKGDVAYDADPETTRARQRLESLIAAADQRDAAVLLATEHVSAVQAWIRDAGSLARWNTLACDKLESALGSELTRIETAGREYAGAVLSSGPRPEKDTYTASGPVSVERITAVRLEVLSHESHPHKGPGRQDNGNLHLSEFSAQLFEPGATQGHPLKFGSATADFNQSGWGIERALDGNDSTAWGIYPAVGQSHQAVFELVEPCDVPAGSRLTVTLPQLHGGGHLIGAFRLSVTSDAPDRAVAIPEDVSSALDTPSADRTQDQQVAIAAFALRQWAQSRLSELPPRAVTFASAKSVSLLQGNGNTTPRMLAEPRPVHVLERGDINRPLEPAQPGALSVLTHRPGRFELAEPNDEAQRRAALAEWLADDKNVLTWRSIVNRVWHYHFGRGLCDTPSDFGRMGGTPSHPELLDWLAVWFRDDAGGSLKALHRLIVTSQTYRQSSAHRPEAAGMDATNVLLWRQNRHRLDADAFHDFTQAVSGRIDLTMGGPAIQHFTQSPGAQLTPNLNYAAYDWNNPASARRAIYRFVWRGIPDPLLETLDFPDLGLLAPARGFSASSLQALALYNNNFIAHHAQIMAERTRRELSVTTSPTQEELAERAARIAWQRPLSDTERAEFAAFVRDHGLDALCRVLLNSNEFLFID